MFPKSVGGAFGAARQRKSIIAQFLVTLSLYIGIAWFLFIYAGESEKRGMTMWQMTQHIYDINFGH
jgi:hypothetical protein